MVQQYRSIRRRRPTGASTKGEAMKLGGLMAAALVVGVMTAASTASATIVDLTYTGIVAADNDTGGYFGSANLTGETFTSFYSFDTSTANITPDGSTIESGSAIGLPSITNSLAIDGNTLYFSNISFVASQEIIGLVASDSANNEYSVSDGISVAAPEADFFLHPFQISNPSAFETGLFNENGSGGYLRLTDRSLTVAVDGVGVSAAPEPSTWALMIAGIGGVGVALRRARRSVDFRDKPAVAA